MIGLIQRVAQARVEVAGEVVGAIGELPTVADLLARIEAEARAALARLGSA